MRRRWRGLGPAAVSAVTAVTLAAASGHLLAAGGDRRFVEPPLATPTRFLEVRGTIAGRMKLDLFVNYQTTAKSCRVVIDRFAGVDSDRIFRSRVTLESSGSSYRASVPLDLVPAGECGWRAWGIEYVASLDGKSHSIPVPPSPLVWFREGASSAPPPLRIECGRQSSPRLPFSTAGDGPECDTSGGGDLFVAPETPALVLDVGVRTD